MITARHRWSDRSQAVTRPLFPDYLFASTSGQGHVSLLRTPGVLTLLKESGRPAALSPQYLERLRTIVENPDPIVERAEPVTVAPGDQVLVRDGPLAGFTGSVVELRGSRRILLLVQGVGRDILCTFGTASVTRFKDASTEA